MRQKKNVKPEITECQVYLNVLDNQVNLDDDDLAVPPAGLELYGGPDDQDVDGNYYIMMGGVNNLNALDLVCKFPLSPTLTSCQFC